MSENYNINIFCANEYITLHPVYLQVRRDILVHLGIANPDDPYDYTNIKTKIVGFANDVAEPFVTLHKSLIPVDVSVTSPCDDTASIPSTATIEQWTATLSCNYAPLLYNPTVGIVAGEKVFMGIEQIVYHCAPGEFPYNPSNFDVTFKFENGTGGAGGIGYILVQFNPDIPGDTTPSAPGTYFFVIHPSAKIYINS